MKAAAPSATTAVLPGAGRRVTARTVNFRTKYSEIAPYITKDGSVIRELMHPNINPSLRQSVAEATVPTGGETLLHRHLKSEEIYHILEGDGRMYLADEEFDVTDGDTVHIPSGTLHRIRNTGSIPLRIFYFCSPAYAHEDTEVMT
jgi:mannose-6-phosphate isomerase-like protein (cupin superfamily)